MKRTKNILALLLSVVMILSLQPSFAVADDGVAKIGETQYATLSAAFEAAQDGNTITMTANSVERDPIVISGKSVILDLNGKTVSFAPVGDNTYSGPYKTWFTVYSGAGLSVIDSATEKGQLIVDPEFNCTICFMRNSGTVNLGTDHSNGPVISMKVTTYNQAVDRTAYATTCDTNRATVDGITNYGTINVNYAVMYLSASNLTGITTYNNATANIDHATFNITNGTTGLTSYNGSNSTIQNCSFVIRERGTGIQTYGAGASIADCTVTMSGTVSASNAYGIDVNKSATSSTEPDVEISNLTLTADYSNYGVTAINVMAGHVVINSANVNIKQNNGYALVFGASALAGFENKAQLEIKGGSYSGELNFWDKGTAVITGGRFNVDPTAYVAAGKHVYFENGMFNVVDELPNGKTDLVGYTINKVDYWWDGEYSNFPYPEVSTIYNGLTYSGLSKDEYLCLTSDIFLIKDAEFGASSSICQTGGTLYLYLNRTSYSVEASATHTITTNGYKIVIPNNISIATDMACDSLFGAPEGYIVSRADYNDKTGFHYIYSAVVAPAVTYVASLTHNGVTTEYESAQEALDRAVDGDTVTLYAGNHGSLYLRQNNFVSVGVDVRQQAGEEWGTNDRYRALSGVTIQGQTGATLEKIVFEAGSHYGTLHSNPDYSKTLDSFMEIDNLTISGLTFNSIGSPALGFGNAGNLRLTGLNVTNCTVNGSGNFGGAERLLYWTTAANHLVSKQNSTLTGVTKTDVDYTTGLSNLSVTNCVFNNLHQVMEIRGIQNFTFTGNTINKTASHALLCVSDTYIPNSLKGTVTVSGNTADQVGDRFFRTNYMLDATVTLTNNTVTSSGKSKRVTDHDASLVAMDNGSNITYTVSGNSWNGNSDEVTVPNTDYFRADPSVWSYVAQIGDTQYETLEAAIANATNNQTIKLLTDVALTGTTNLQLNKSITLDLVGYTLTAERINLKQGGLTITTSVADGKVVSSGQAFNVYGSTTDQANFTTLTIDEGVTVEAQYAVCLFPVDNTVKVSYGATININGTLTGSKGTVFVSGNLGDAAEPGAALAASDNIPVINVGSTAVITNTGNNDQAIAMNGMAKVVISEGASVTGREAIGLKRGILIVNGGTFTANGAKKDPAEANMNGTEATGAALSITSTYNYAGMISATIKGGTFTSTNNTAVYVGHAKKDSSAVAYNKGVTLAIKDGAFNGAAGSGAIYVASAINGETIPSGFITGGTFDADPSTYVAVGYEAKENAGKWTVVKAEVAIDVPATIDDDTTASVKIGDEEVATVAVTIAPAATVAAVEKATAATVTKVEEAVNVSAVVQKAMDNGTIVKQEAPNTIELLIKADDTPVAVPNVTVEEEAVVIKVDPYAIVNGDTANPIKLTNDDLATNSTGFTFTLSLGAGFANEKVTLKHYSDDGEPKGTWNATADENGDVTVTLTSFSYIVGELASSATDCAGYLYNTDADIRASLLWNVYFYIDTAVIENPLSAKIVVSSEYDDEIDGLECSLTKVDDYYKITVPIRHRLIDQDVGFTLVYNNTEYSMKLGVNGQEYLSVPYSFNAYLTGLAAAYPEYADVIAALRAYRDALLAKWPVNNN